MIYLPNIMYLRDCHVPSSCPSSSTTMYVWGVDHHPNRWHSLRSVLRQIIVATAYILVPIISIIYLIFFRVKLLSISYFICYIWIYVDKICILYIPIVCVLLGIRNTVKRWLVWSQGYKSLEHYPCLN